MKCQQCQYKNREGVKFCENCGAKFELACPACKANVPVATKFCGNCGQKLVSPFTKSDKISTIESERKRVTILFSDLSGYTAMAEKIDPEEVKDMMSRVFGEVAQIVNKYEGFIEKFIGDAVMALFGVPHAHEDDPVRAIKAAREIHAAVNAISPKIEEKIGQALKMHSGINTGLVVTGDVNLDKGTHGVVGDTVNLASRLAGMAKPGEIVISAETYKLSATYYKVTKLEPFPVKGKAQLISAYRVDEELGVANIVDAFANRGLTTLSGRGHELKLLNACLAKAVNGQGQFITIVGEAGVGKSRLVYEFQHSFHNNKITTWRGHCQSFWSATSYFPFINMLKLGLFQQEEKNHIAIDEIAVSKICAINQHLKKYLPFYLNLLSIPSNQYPLPDHLAGQELNNVFQDAIAALITLQSERRPLMLIFDDWQWADQASDSALKHLVSILGSHPLMVITIYRPIYASKWSNYSYHRPLILEPLDGLNSKNIVKSALKVDHVPAGLLELIIKQTGGNPLFIEEVCHSLIETNIVEVNQAKQATLTQGLGTLVIPDKVNAIISARFDRQDPDAKETLRIASVVGRRFKRPILENIYQGKKSLFKVLEHLKEHQMIQQTTVFPEVEYWFRNPLTRDVIYNSLLLRHRKAMHGIVGEIIEQLYPNRIKEQSNLLHYHFSRAENWLKAMRYGRICADKALKMSQFSAAISMFDQVLECLSHLPDDKKSRSTRLDILLQQERLYETLGQRDQQQRIIDNLTHLVDPDSEQELLAETDIRQGDLFTQTGNFDEAERFVKSALSKWRTLSNSEGESRSLRSLGFLRWHQGRFKEAAECNEAALAIDRQREDLIAVATDLTNLGAVLRNLEDPKRSLDCLEEALKIYESNQKPVKQAFTLYSIANVHRDQGELTLAMTQYNRAHKIFENNHDRIMSSRSLAGIASIYRKQGKIDESLHLYRKVVKEEREINFRQGLAHALRVLGELMHTVNRPKQAVEHLLECTAVFSELKDQQSEADVWEMIGNIYEQDLNDYNEAIQAWKETKKLRIKLKNLERAIDTIEKMARLAKQQLNDLDMAHDFFHDALDLSVEIGNRKKQATLLNNIGIVEWHQQSFTKALKSYKSAFDIFHDLNDRAYEGLLLNSIGVTLHKLGQHSDALDHLKRAVTFNHNSNEALLEGHGLAAIGDICRDLGEHEKAIYHYKASLEIRRKIGDIIGKGWMLYSLSHVYHNQGADSQAAVYLSKAQTIAQAYNNPALRRACEEMHIKTTGQE